MTTKGDKITLEIPTELLPFLERSNLLFLQRIKYDQSWTELHHLKDVPLACQICALTGVPTDMDQAKLVKRLMGPGSEKKKNILRGYGHTSFDVVDNTDAESANGAPAKKRQNTGKVHQVINKSEKCDGVNKPEKVDAQPQKVGDGAASGKPEDGSAQI